MRLELFLVSAGGLYQSSQKEAAASAARAAGVELEISFADGDSKRQRDQVFAAIRAAKPPDGMVIHPVEEAGLRFAVAEALRKDVACAICNRAPTWVPDMARESGSRVCAVTADQKAIGRVQGEQFRALLPGAGNLLYVLGPPIATAVQQRQAGMEETKGPQISTIAIVGNWREAGAAEAVKEWVATTRGFVPINLVGAQNDDMAAGARRALHEAADVYDKPDWRSLPVTGVDGIASYGQRLVDSKALTATIIVPTTAGRAVELLAARLRDGTPPPPLTTLPVSSYPPVDQLRRAR